MDVPEAPAVPLFDNSHELDAIWDPLMIAVSNVLRCGDYILGNETEQFERALAAWLQCGHAIGVASGSDALYLALAGNGIGPGDEVVTSPFTFIATVQAITRVGARPVFADIDPHTLNLDERFVESVITDRTAAVLVVHIFGQPCDMDTFGTLAGHRGLALIEDAAQALGSTWRGQRTGTFGDAAAISFFPTKTLGAAGDGGAVVTNDADIDQKVRRLRIHGALEKYLYTVLGTNSRLDELQAAILNVKLPRLDAWIRQRRAIADAYSDAIPRSACRPLDEDERAKGAFSQYTVRVPDGRDSLRDYLCQARIGTAVHYPRPLHLQPALSMLGYRQGDFPIAEQACREVLSLPCYPGLSGSAVSRVAEMIAEWQVNVGGGL
ncbi:DegT/DnrJ/EryC1/StrS family aminotransferase [Actinoallomurus sp. CA-150999]|uniref:DegT/DnrJ/EryC1/StrS family aminotransferase n=1 Tax=Actinoallomurus sp. CA-150999 TaxID=3239887 RepID=UPI003D8A389B